MATRRAFRRGSSQRRPTFWEGATFQALPSIAGAPATVSTLVTEALLENVPEPTVVRIRGSYVYSETAIDGTAACAMGIMLVDKAALAVGIGSLPTPLADIGSDWIWWDIFGLDNVGTVAADPVRTGSRMIDSKAMRKVKMNEQLVLITEVVALGAAAAVVTIAGGVRVLFKR